MDQRERSLPPVGLGTMGLDATAVKTALDVGYRHLDTARIYENEREVGEAIAESAVPREELFLATKLWVDDLSPEAVPRAAAESRERLGVDALDLLYVHRPRGDYDPDGTLGALAALREEGTVREVGVSNFTVEQLETARRTLGEPPFAHQTELHPLFYRPELVEHAREHDYYVVAYSPLAGGRAREIPAVREVAARREATPEQVCLAWLAGKENVVVIPRSESEAHLRANLAALDVELDADDVARIEAIEREEELFPE